MNDETFPGEIQSWLFHFIDTYDKPQNVVYSISNGSINDITFTDGRCDRKFEKNQFNTYI